GGVGGSGVWGRRGGRPPRGRTQRCRIVRKPALLAFVPDIRRELPVAPAFFPYHRGDPGEITLIEEFYPFCIHRLNLGLLSKRRRDQPGHEGNHQCDPAHDYWLPIAARLKLRKPRRRRSTPRFGGVSAFWRRCHAAALMARAPSGTRLRSTAALEQKQGTRSASSIQTSSRLAVATSPPIAEVVRLAHLSREEFVFHQVRTGSAVEQGRSSYSFIHARTPRVLLPH